MTASRNSLNFSNPKGSARRRSVKHWPTCSRFTRSRWMKCDRKCRSETRKSWRCLPSPNCQVQGVGGPEPRLPAPHRAPQRGSHPEGRASGNGRGPSRQAGREEQGDREENANRITGNSREEQDHY
ncbi:unnamed protein product [Notodromas monacha]|uniref:Uncharacterized protein n=1 Tax=Notodromas monacha TaxID=399045 RepID=A0A7R9C199_9CRUS|nr:unnamed protein product [Notodromas monacha]CAG0925565.1 unnamed protein product [Notodromas monacha]